MKIQMLIASLCFSSISFAQSVVQLQVGQTIRASDLGYGDVVACGYVTPTPPPYQPPYTPQPPPYQPPYTPQPPPYQPPPPPPPQCQLSSVESSISSTRNRMNRLQNGKCGYSVNRCGDNLEDHAVADTKNALYNDISSIRQALEAQCSSQACAPYEIRSAQQSLDDLINQARSSQMTYKEDGNETRHQASMLDSDAGLHARCY